MWSTGLEVCLEPVSVSSSVCKRACCDCCAHAGIDPFFSSESHWAAATWRRRMFTLLPATLEEKLHWTPPILMLFQSPEMSTCARTKVETIPWPLAAFTREKEILLHALRWWDKPASSASPSLRLARILNTSKDRLHLKKKRMWGSQIHKRAPRSRS